MSFYYKSSSEHLLKYYKNKGVKIGSGTFVLDPKKIQIDITRPELLEIGENVFYIEEQSFLHMIGLLGVLLIHIMNSFLVMGR